ncbi:MAG: hypothetical protein HY658_14465 [Actinobacteria bacterium]|nr:hypothetical protein [Actinomycetota bacterium]
MTDGRFDRAELPPSGEITTVGRHRFKRPPTLDRARGGSPRGSPRVGWGLAFLGLFIVAIGAVWILFGGEDGSGVGALIAVLLSVWLLFLLLVAARAYRPVPATAREPFPARPEEGRAVVTIDLKVGLASPPAERLAREAAARVLAAMPEVGVVEARSREGVLLARLERRVRLPGPVATSPVLEEPHARRDRAPSVRAVDDLEPLPAPLRAPGVRRPGDAAALDEPGHWPLVERFDLPVPVRSAIGHPDDPVELVRAILSAGGHRPEVRGDLLLVGGVAVFVCPTTSGRIPREELDHAYLRVVEAAVPRGLVVGFGLIDPVDARRREALAPQVLHAGPDAVQRMADAVALGEDPLRFVSGAPVVDARGRALATNGRPAASG